MPFDKEKRLNELLAHFKQTDQFYDKFKDEFKNKIVDLILDYQPECLNKKEAINEMVMLYASEVISATESVIDKDENYPEYRKIEELDYMNKLLHKEMNSSKHIERNKFSETIHIEAKKLVVKHFPDIINLSNHGFRLLERNMKMYLLHFMAQFMSIVEK